MSKNSISKSHGIICKKVRKKYGDLSVLKGIDVTIDIGNFYVFFGPNGAGKTTLMKVLCGLTQVTSGNVTVSGMDTSDPMVRKKIGVISHKSFLYDSLSAFENLMFYAKLYEVENPEKRVKEMLRKVELFDRKKDLIRYFSRGMLQRMSIARAIIADPDFILLDEPFTGLDQHSATLFKDLLKRLHKQGKTVIMITHNMQLGFSLSTNVLILKKGKKIYDEEAKKINITEFKKIYIENIGQ